MSLLIKTIANRKYAYIAYRVRDKIVHKYVGSMSDKKVIDKINILKKECQIPVQYHSFFWDTDPKKVDLKRNKRYVIERILEMGGLDAFEWLQRVYPTKLIIESCLAGRNLSEKSKLFWELWLGVVRA